MQINSYFNHLTLVIHKYQFSIRKFEDQNKTENQIHYCEDIVKVIIHLKFYNLMILISNNSLIDNVVNILILI